MDGIRSFFSTIVSKNALDRFAARKETFGFLAVLGAAAALYLYHLGFSDIWADEAFTKAIIRHPLRDLLRLVAGDFQPPLYFLALKFFTGVLGNADWTIRLFSVLGALSTLVLGYTAGQRVFGKPGALCLCLLLAALPMPGLYSHVARMYTWTAFVTTGVFFHAVLYARDARKADLALLGLFSLMAAYIHYYCLIAAFWSGLALLAICFAKRLPAWRAVAVMGAAVFLLFLPWLFVLLSQARAVHKDYWIPAVSWSTLLTCYAQPFGGLFRLYPHSYVLLAIIGVLTTASVCRWAFSSNSEHQVPLGLSLLVFNATILTAATMSLLVKPILYPRYVMTVAPLLLIPPLLALTSWRRTWLKALVLGGIVYCGGFVVLAESTFSWGPYQQALRQLSKAHPEVRKILHVTELTAGPLAEYGRGGPWSQGYFKNDQSSWYSNMEALDGMTPLKRLSDWVKRDEIFCLVVFDKLPLNRANIDLLLAQCQTLAVDDVVDEKPYSGAKLKLYILSYNGP